MPLLSAGRLLPIAGGAVAATMLLAMTTPDQLVRLGYRSPAIEPDRVAESVYLSFFRKLQRRPRARSGVLSVQETAAEAHYDHCKNRLDVHNLLGFTRAEDTMPGGPLRMLRRRK